MTDTVVQSFISLYSVSNIICIQVHIYYSGLEIVQARFHQKPHRYLYEIVTYPISHFKNYLQYTLARYLFVFFFINYQTLNLKVKTNFNSQYHFIF